MKQLSTSALSMPITSEAEFLTDLNLLGTVLRKLTCIQLLMKSSTTLSGGEAQRVKLATELAKRETGSTVYVLDEPTTGLHVADIHKLIHILDRLVDAGNTVVVIEHNLDVIKVADHIIDLGPEGGDGGGSLVFAGTPEDCAKCAESYTGEYLKPLLDRGKTATTE
jgi:excinuclease ABC subunit A